MDQALYEEDLEANQVALDVGAAIWRVWTPVVIHIPRELTPAILTGTRVSENKAGSLNTGNRDVGSDNLNQAVDTRKIISRV